MQAPNLKKCQTSVVVPIIWAVTDFSEYRQARIEVMVGVLRG